MDRRTPPSTDRRTGMRKKGRKHGPCRGGSDWIRALASSIALVAALGASAPGFSVPLGGVWSPTYRNNIRVYLCITRFDQQFPSWDKDVLRANVRNALDTWNAYSGVDFHFSWQGDLTCSQPDCNGRNDPVECRDGELPSGNGTVAIRAQDCHEGRGVLASALWGGAPDITRGAIGVYRANSPNCVNTITWTFDHTPRRGRLRLRAHA